MWQKTIDLGGEKSKPTRCWIFHSGTSLAGPHHRENASSRPDKTKRPRIQDPEALIRASLLEHRCEKARPLHCTRKQPIRIGQGKTNGTVRNSAIVWEHDALRLRLDAALTRSIARI
jgi:hypothetical protein